MCPHTQTGASKGWTPALQAGGAPGFSAPCPPPLLPTCPSPGQSRGLCCTASALAWPHTSNRAPGRGLLPPSPPWGLEARGSARETEMSRGRENTTVLSVPERTASHVGANKVRKNIGGARRSIRVRGVRAVPQFSPPWGRDRVRPAREASRKPYTEPGARRMAGPACERHRGRPGHEQPTEGPTETRNGAGMATVHLLGRASCPASAAGSCHHLPSPCPHGQTGPVRARSSKAGSFPTETVPRPHGTTRDNHRIPGACERILF